MRASSAAPAPRRSAAAAATTALLFAASLFIASACPAWAGRLVTDSAGRRVEIPDRVSRVIAAGPPASVLMVMLAPEKLLGWNRLPSPDEVRFLPAPVRKLPEIGRLTGRGGTANIETILAAKPDIIVDFGSVNDTYVSLANRTQEQTGVPYILIDGRFANTARALRLMGDILGVPEIIERAGGINVVESDTERGGLRTASLEQILAWNPGIIVTLDKAFAAAAPTAPGWRDVDAVRNDRLFVSPALPYGWIDAPPSLNRLIGTRWLARKFFPSQFSDDLNTITREFYRLFYQVQLDDTDLPRLLGTAGSK